LDLFSVRWACTFYGFQLDDHFILDDKISAKPLIESDPPIDNRHENLPLDAHATLRQLVSQRRFVHDLQKSGT